MYPTISPRACPQEPGENSSKRLVSAQARIWEVAPFGCHRYGHEMKIISLIDEPDVIERILPHLGLWKQHPGSS
jgi:hypothetical protein